MEATVPGFVLLAAAAAGLMGLDPILSKRGLALGGTWLDSTLLLLAVRMVVFWPALLVVAGGTDPFAGMTLAVAALFVAASLVASAFGRLLFYASVDRLGSTLTNGLATVRPLFTVVLASVLLGELVTPRMWVGVVVLVAGLVAITVSRGGDVRGWKSADLVFPLATAVAASVGNVVRRFGFTLEPVPVLQAVVVGETAAFLAVAAVAATVRRDEVGSAPRPAYGYLAAAGLVGSASYLAFLAALAAGPVSVVDPIGATAPLVTVAVAAVVLRDLERVTGRLLVGVTLVVGGVALITG